jgi:hypothetical protein
VIANRNELLRKHRESKQSAGCEIRILNALVRKRRASHGCEKTNRERVAAQTRARGPGGDECIHACPHNSAPIPCVQYTVCKVSIHAHVTLNEAQEELEAWLLHGYLLCGYCNLYRAEVLATGRECNTQTGFLRGTGKWGSEKKLGKRMKKSRKESEEDEEIGEERKERSRSEHSTTTHKHVMFSFMCVCVRSCVCA